MPSFISNEFACKIHKPGCQAEYILCGQSRLYWTSTASLAVYSVQQLHQMICAERKPWLFLLLSSFSCGSRTCEKKLLLQSCTRFSPVLWPPCLTADVSGTVRTFCLCNTDGVYVNCSSYSAKTCDLAAEGCGFPSPITVYNEILLSGCLLY